MADIVRIGSGVPRIPLRRAEELIGKLEALRAVASAQGFGTIAYFLDAALDEARFQRDRHEEDGKIGNAPPDELWLPVQDKD